MLIIVILALPVIIAVTAFSIDVATIWVQRDRVQVAADSGALAAAQDVVNGQVGTTATTDANTYVAANDSGASDTVTTSYNNDPDAIKVTASKKVSLMFAGLFGLSSSTVSATAVATSNLTTPLAYFGSDEADLQDGSSTPDGWDNFCSSDGSSYTNQSGQTSDNNRCPSTASPSDNSLDGWNMAHGGVDISVSNFWSPPGTSDQMVDLTGTCVEGPGNWPDPPASNHTSSTSINGTGYDGDCVNNADGELDESFNSIPGATYKLTFELGSNTWGYPAEKPLMVMVTDSNPSGLAAMADTNASDNSSASTASNEDGTQDGTTYPLETGSTWPSLGGNMVKYEQYEYIGPTGGFDGDGDTDPDWTSVSLSFTANKSLTYIAFGSLVNCVGDWYTGTLKSGFYSSGYTSDDPDGGGYTPTVLSQSTFSAPPAQVHADLGAESGGTWEDECKYGPGISDVDVVGPNAESLTQ